jgi:mono/diheme cytochrome c family protein
MDVARDGGAAPPSSDLPCDLDQLLRERCQKCHTRPPRQGAPMALVSYADLIAPAKSDPAQRAIDLALTRMQRGQMPPAPESPATCTSGAYWKANGDNASALMHPGGACITCHAQNEGPRFVIAGTVYPSAHEPIDCNGVDGSNQAVTVEITDANGAVTTLSVNRAGNFYSSMQIAMPFHAKVRSNGRERQMGAAQMTGNCNSCHTELGANGAPGRIMAP